MPRLVCKFCRSEQKLNSVCVGENIKNHTSWPRGGVLIRAPRLTSRLTDCDRNFPAARRRAQSVRHKCQCVTHNSKESRDDASRANEPEPPLSTFLLKLRFTPCTSGRATAAVHFHRRLGSHRISSWPICRRPSFIASTASSAIQGSCNQHIDEFNRLLGAVPVADTSPAGRPDRFYD